MESLINIGREPSLTGSLAMFSTFPFAENSIKKELCKNKNKLLFTNAIDFISIDFFFVSK